MSDGLRSRRADRNRERPLRAGLICLGDPHDPDHLSGMPYHSMRALIQAGVDVVPLLESSGRRSCEPLWDLLTRVADPLRNAKMIRSIGDRLRERRRLRDRAADARSTYEHQLDTARETSERINRHLAALDLDLVFGVCISTPLYAIDTELPIIYSSDATARLIFESYAAFASSSDETKRACMEFETTAMARVEAGIFPSRRTLASAIADHGLPPERAHLVPYGANVLPRSAQRIDPDPPTRRGLELVIVASDPERKRLDLCVEATEILNARGVQTKLNAIGPPTPRASRSPWVECMGPLKLSDAEDHVIHQNVLQRSHLMILPSKGEMLGIAPGEAAHFGRPSLVSDVGGLPTVVEHGKTGLVLAPDADAGAYASAIIGLVDDADRYRSFSAAALERARAVLTWSAFAKSTLGIFRDVLAHRQRIENRALAIDP